MILQEGLVLSHHADGLGMVVGPCDKPLMTVWDGLLTHWADLTVFVDLLAALTVCEIRRTGFRENTQYTVMSKPVSIRALVVTWDQNDDTAQRRHSMCTCWGGPHGVGAGA